MRVRNRGISRRGGIAALGAAAWLMFVGGTAWAQLLQIERLDPRLEAVMAPDAREQYEIAWNLIDRIAYTLAYTRFDNAVQAEPANYHLRMLTIELGRYLGRTKFGNEASDYYQSVVGHYEDLVKQNLTPDQRREVITQLEGAENDQNARRLLASLVQRDEQRRARGLEVARDYARRVYGRQGEEEEVGESAAARAVREALRRPIEGMSIVDQINLALGGIAPTAPGFVSLGTGAPPAGGAPVTLATGGLTPPAAMTAMDNAVAPDPFTTEPTADQRLAIQTTMDAAVIAIDSKNGEAFKALMTEKAQGSAGLIQVLVQTAENPLIPDPSGIMVNFDEAEVPIAMTIDAQPVDAKMWLREETGEWKIFAIAFPGTPGAELSYLDFEAKGEAMGPLGGLFDALAVATARPDDITTPADEAQQADIERVLTQMLDASDRLDADAFTALFTEAARPVASTIVHEAPPPGATHEVGQAFADETRAQVSYLTKTPNQPDEGGVVYFKVEIGQWRAYAMTDGDGQFLNLEQAVGAMNQLGENIVGMFAEAFEQSGFAGAPDAPGGAPRGELAGRLYTNDVLKMRFEIPEPWTIVHRSINEMLAQVTSAQVARQNDQLRQALEAQSSVVLLQVMRRPLGQMIPFNNNVMITASKLEPAGTTPVDMLNASKNLLSANPETPVTFDDVLRARTIGGVVFDLMHAEIATGAEPLQQDYHAAIVEGYAISISVSYVGPQQQAELIELLGAIEFTALQPPPRP